MTVRDLRLMLALSPTGWPPWVVSVVLSVSVAWQGTSAEGAQLSLSVTAASLEAGLPDQRERAQRTRSKPLAVARAVGVAADGGAVPRRGARHRAEAGILRVCAGVCGQRRLDAGRPRARRLAQQQPL